MTLNIGVSRVQEGSTRENHFRISTQSKTKQNKTQWHNPKGIAIKQLGISVSFRSRTEWRKLSVRGERIIKVNARNGQHLKK